jgi:hypothetical protein
MSTKTTLALSVIAATAIAFVIGPALIQSASADPVPKTREQTTTNCSDPRFADRPSCPGKSEESSGEAGEEREDETTTTCFARNEGQAKNCPPDSTVVIVGGSG